MATFEVGDKARQVEAGGPGEVGDVFPVEQVLTDPWGDTYVYFPHPHGGGWDMDRFEKVEPLSQEWQDKIEAALGRDALVTLGVVEPEPAFKVGDRVVYVLAGQVIGSHVGTVVAQHAPDTFQVAWDNDICINVNAKVLAKVETVKVAKQAIQVQFHVEAGGLPEARADNLRTLTAGFLRDRAFDMRADTKVTTQVYNYTETHEVLPRSQA